MSTISFPLFSVDAPDEWQDLEEESVPTLGRAVDGVGALQLTVGIYRGGPLPSPTTTDLLEMVWNLARSNELDSPYDVESRVVPFMSAAASFDWGTNFLRIWMVSDGQNFGQITYVCELGQQVAELDDCENIVASLKFNAAKQ